MLEAQQLCTCLGTRTALDVLHRRRRVYCCRHLSLPVHLPHFRQRCDSIAADSRVLQQVLLQSPHTAKLRFAPWALHFVGEGLDGCIADKLC